MALPGDVSTFTLGFGPYTDASGAVALVGAKGKLFPVDPVKGKRLNLVHIATGQEIIPNDLTVTIGSDGTASVGPLPHTDNPGLSTVGFAYRAEWAIASSKPSPGNLTFAAPAAAGATVDYDLLTPAEAVPGIAVPVVTGAAGAPGVADDASVAATIADTTSATAAALRVAFGSVAVEVLAGLPPASDTLVALDPAPWFYKDIVRHPASGAVTSATLLWPDGSLGTYTADVLSTKFPGTVDAYHVTKGIPATVTYTQDLVSRDAYGNITYRPALQNTYPALPYDFLADEQLLFNFRGDTLGADTTAVTSWPSSGGTSGYTTALAQATGGAQPLVKANALNGRKSALFDGVDDFLSSGTYAASRAQPVTLLTVAKVTTSGATKWLYAGQGTTSGNLELSVSTGGTAAAKAGTGTTVTAAGTTFDAWHVFAAVFNGATTKLYRDAVTEVATGTVTSGDLPSALGGTRLGRSAASVYFSGEIAQHAAVGRALSSGEIRDAMQALGTYYGLTIGA